MRQGNAPTDAELIERCLNRENAAWEEIVARFRRRVFHIAYKFTGRVDDAEDLTQEIFLKVFKSREKFNRDADFGTWLQSVARNYCIDRYRASKREREVVVDDLIAFDLAPSSSGNPHRAVEERDRRTFLKRGLDQLAPKLREAVMLRDLQGLQLQRDGGAARPAGGYGQEPDQSRARGAVPHPQEVAPQLERAASRRAGSCAGPSESEVK